MNGRLKRVDDVVAARLCLGCGACAYSCPGRIRLVDVEREGIRPAVESTDCGTCSACLDVCPAVETDIRYTAKREGIVEEAHSGFGPVLDIWEGYATDSEIRFKGSSGGALTALSLFCLEQEQAEGVLHIGQDPQDPLRNKTRLSRSRSELMECVGSRYAPASACDGLAEIEKAERPCVFVGQPSEVSALRKAEKLNPRLKQNVSLALSFFCAGSPSTQGTKDLLDKLGVDSGKLDKLRYRGYGWPGMLATQKKGVEDTEEHIPYKDTWRAIQRYRPYSTYLWPDGSGEEADISCGDPWHRDVKQDKLGYSLIITRTERGRQALKAAMAAGYIQATPSTVERLYQSQGYLVKKRGAAGGRIFAFKLMGRPTPKYKGFSLFSNWLKLPLAEKARSIIGTIQRVISRKLYKHLKFDPITGKTL